MTPLIPRKRFFSQESGGHSFSTPDLPLLNHVVAANSCAASSSSSSNSSTSSCISEEDEETYNNDYPNRCESPPASGSYNYTMDYGKSKNSNADRVAPGRASSMSIVRQRSGQTLSPDAKHLPRKSVSMFFSSPSTDSTTNRSFDHQYHHQQQQQQLHHQHHQPYGMLNPNKSSFLRRTQSGLGLNRYNSHNNNYRQNLSEWLTSVLALVAFLTLTLLTWSAWSQNSQLHSEVLFKEREIEMHLQHSYILERKVQKMRSESIHLQNRVEELEHPTPTEEELNIQRKVFHLEHYQDQLHKGIAQQSKRLLIDKYGPGPKYYIVMKLAFHPESNIVQDAQTEIEDTIWIETAHIDEMPHTVHFFLEQVSHGLFDGTKIYRNAPRFVQAGPAQNQLFLDHLEQDEPSLTHVLFQEHSSQLNHQQYTLGYPGRPGGPDFYMNLQDNSDQHGLGAVPSARSHMMEEADPCFARIIRGFSTLERIHRSNIFEEEQAGFTRRKQHRMIHPVTIVSMKIHNAHDADPKQKQSQAR